MDRISAFGRGGGSESKALPFLFPLADALLSMQMGMWGSKEEDKVMTGRGRKVEGESSGMVSRRCRNRNGIRQL